MKKLAILLFALTGLTAFSQTNLTTLDGVVYHNAKFTRHTPQTLYFDYTPEGGGMGMAGVKFSNLPDDIRQHFHYDREDERQYVQARKEAFDKAVAEHKQWQQDNFDRSFKVAQLNMQNRVIQAQALRTNTISKSSVSVKVGN